MTKRELMVLLVLNGSGHSALNGLQIASAARWPWWHVPPFSELHKLETRHLVQRDGGIRFDNEPIYWEITDMGRDELHKQLLERIKGL